ncbi:hypothetical protein [Qipengyuania algicida]|uniref:hypothetical protein n=1 Tax=Qipengyuania algicida TaxID=1836209 RepID=UPI001926D5EF|nr:hypothetical protein [Qipengyuania algicida]
MALSQKLRQMIALLEGERDALAKLDLERILVCAEGKSAIGDQLSDDYGPDAIDDECRGLLDAAQRMNAVNRKMRNLIAANVQSRLDALAGTTRIYATHEAPVRMATSPARSAWHDI